MSDKDAPDAAPSKRGSVHFEPLDETMNTKGDWLRDLVNRLVFASLNEQRRARVVRRGCDNAGTGAGAFP